MFAFIPRATFLFWSSTPPYPRLFSVSSSVIPLLCLPPRPFLLYDWHVVYYIISLICPIKDTLFPKCLRSFRIPYLPDLSAYVVSVALLISVGLRPILYFYFWMAALFFFLPPHNTTPVVQKWRATSSTLRIKHPRNFRSDFLYFTLLNIVLSHLLLTLIPSSLSLPFPYVVLRFTLAHSTQLSIFFFS